MSGSYIPYHDPVQNRRNELWDEAKDNLHVAGICALGTATAGVATFLWGGVGAKMLYEKTHEEEYRQFSENRALVDSALSYDPSSLKNSAFVRQANEVQQAYLGHVDAWETSGIWGGGIIAAAVAAYGVRKLAMWHKARRELKALRRA